MGGWGKALNCAVLIGTEECFISRLWWDKCHIDLSSTFINDELCTPTSYTVLFSIWHTCMPTYIHNCLLFWPNPDFVNLSVTPVVPAGGWCCHSNYQIMENNSCHADIDSSCAVWQICPHIRRKWGFGSRFSLHYLLKEKIADKHESMLGRLTLIQLSRIHTCIYFNIQLLQLQTQPQHRVHWFVMVLSHTFST